MLKEPRQLSGNFYVEFFPSLELWIPGFSTPHIPRFLMQVFLPKFLILKKSPPFPKFPYN